MNLQVLSALLFMILSLDKILLIQQQIFSFKMALMDLVGKKCFYFYFCQFFKHFYFSKRYRVINQKVLIRL